MSRRDNCWDNAVMERFFRILKTEKLNYQSFANHKEVVDVERYIYFYNDKRIHSTIGYMTSAQKMAELKKSGFRMRPKKLGYYTFITRLGVILPLAINHPVIFSKIFIN